MKPNKRRGVGTLTVVLILIMLGVLAAMGFVLKGNSDDGEADNAPDVFEVARGSFDITVPASGELAAMRQTDISSQLETRAVITEVVDEGVLVEAGEVLIRLDSEEITNRIKDAEVAVKNAETAWTTAKSNLQIRQDSNRSQLQLADVDIRLADLAIKAWEAGDDVSKQQQLELDVETNKKDFDRLLAKYEASEDLLAQEFISQDEYDRDEIEMIKSRSRYEQAKLAQEVYLDYLRVQERERLAAALKKAQDSRSETKQRGDNEIANLTIEVDNRHVSLERERERLEKARKQLERCTIVAPQAGLVVYTSSLSSGRYGRNEDSPPEVGTELRRNKTVMILPDTSRMIAEVKVNEALSGRIEKGQPVVIFSDAVPDTPLEGEVLGVGVLAESGGWRDPNRRDYTVRIELKDANVHGLKPSMRCKANIFVGQVDDSIFVPVQAVFRRGATAFVYEPDGSGYRETAISLGRSSELYIEVLDGLDEGDLVLLREPAADRVTSHIEDDPGGRRPNGAPDATARRGGTAGATPAGGRAGSGGGRPAAAQRRGSSGGGRGGAKGAG